MIACEICGKEFSIKGIGTHKWRVHGDGKNFVPKSYGAWNKGLTKETDERLKKSGQTFTRRLENGEIKTWQEGKLLSEAHKKSIQDAVIQRVNSENWHSFRKSKICEYKGIRFDSGWEAKLAEWFDKNDVQWIRNKEHFAYTFEGKSHVYFPDFYVQSIDCYVEVKGRTSTRDEAKWESFPKRLIVLKRDELRNAKII